MTEKRFEVKRNIGDLLRPMGVFLFVLILLGVGRLVSPEFYSSRSLGNIADNISLLGIVAVGMTFVTFSGHYADLSVPGAMALSGVVTVSCLSQGFPVAACLGLAAALVIGVVNGLVIGRLRVNPIIWTLSTNAIAYGVIRWWYEGKQKFPEGTGAQAFISFYRGTFLDVPSTVAGLVFTVILGQAVISKTGFGARLKILGSNFEVARMTGIDTRATVLGAFTLCSLAAGLAGIFSASFAQVGSYEAGQGYDFQAVTAVVLGGVSLSGGRGSVVAALGGVLVIGLLASILSQLGLGSFTKNIAQGLVFLLVVGVSAYGMRKGGREDE